MVLDFADLESALGGHAKGVVLRISPIRLGSWNSHRRCRKDNKLGVDTIGVLLVGAKSSIRFCRTSKSRSRDLDKQQSACDS